MKFSEIDQYEPKVINYPCGPNPLDTYNSMNTIQVYFTDLQLARTKDILYIDMDGLTD